MAGPVVIVEPSPDLPLVWFDVAIRGGSGADPVGVDGLHYHAGTLARRGTRRHDRAQLDEMLDNVGASVDFRASHDRLTLSSLCLARHLDAVVELAADVLAEPRWAEDEHARLQRETLRTLDEIRDDDHELARRWFDRVCAPAHPYGRSRLGTPASIAAIQRDAVIELWRREVTADNLTIGLAGDIDDATAARVVARIVERLPATASRPPLPHTDVQPAGARRLYLVDKPDRTQVQLRLGHLSIRYGDPDTAAIAIAETIFGGMFSSRLMQEIRVKRGWSYGATCELHRSRLPHWFAISMAAGIDVAGAALALTLEMFDDYAAHGPTDAEVEFARSYLIGAMPFHVATAHQRMQLAVRDQVFGLPVGYSVGLPEALAGLSASDVRAACLRCLRPESTVTVAVTTADQAREEGLAEASAGMLTVVDHDEY